MKRVDLRVTGLVQGVFFRASTQNAARELGVRGTVRNEPDGSVFIEAEGDAAAVDRFIEWCRQGPPSAQVSGVTVTERDPSRFSGFSITR